MKRTKILAHLHEKFSLNQFSFRVKFPGLLKSLSNSKKKKKRVFPTLSFPSLLFPLLVGSPIRGAKSRL